MGNTYGVVTDAPDTEDADDADVDKALEEVVETASSMVNEPDSANTWLMLLEITNESISRASGSR